MLRLWLQKFHKNKSVDLGFSRNLWEINIWNVNAQVFEAIEVFRNSSKGNKVFVQSSASYNENMFLHKPTPHRNFNPSVPLMLWYQYCWRSIPIRIPKIHTDTNTKYWYPNFKQIRIPIPCLRERERESNFCQAQPMPSPAGAEIALLPANKATRSTHRISIIEPLIDYLRRWNLEWKLYLTKISQLAN